MCRRWAVLNPSVQLESRSRRLKNRATTLAARKEQLEQVRHSLTQELHATDQAYQLIDAMSWNLGQERASLNQKQLKAQELTSQREQWKLECQKTDELATECAELRRRLQTKQSQVAKQRASLQESQNFCEQTRTQRKWAICRTRTVQEKSHNLQALEGEITQCLTRAESEIEARAKTIGQLMERIDWAEDRLRNKHCA